jgi:ankyrin repeat protein
MTERTPEDLDRIVAFAMDCARDGQTALLADFLDGGFPIDHPDADGNTALMLAAYHGHAETVTMLVARGADVDRLNDRQQSPIAGALFKGEDAVVAVLRAAGADLDHGTPTARQAAAMFGTGHLLDDEGPREFS